MANAPNGTMTSGIPSISLGTSNGQVRYRSDRTNGSTPYASSSRSNGIATTPSANRKGKGKARDHSSGSGIRTRTRRALVRELFRRFGEHCARNQIRTLLIDCLVITNLFYPSLTLYLRKRYPPLHPPAQPSHNTHRVSPSGKPLKEHPLSLLSTPILDSFFPYPRPLLPRIPWAGWWDESDPNASAISQGWQAIRLGKDDTLMGYGEEIRIMRFGWADVGDILEPPDLEREKEWIERDHSLVKIVREMAEDWERQTIDGSRCVRHLTKQNGEVAQSGECYLWSSNTPPPIDAERNSRNTTIFAADWDVHDGAIYHGVSAVFAVPRSSVSSFELRWTEMMTAAAKRVDGEAFDEAKGPSGMGAQRTGDFLLSVRITRALKNLADAKFRSGGDSAIGLGHAEEGISGPEGGISSRSDWLVPLLYIVLVGGLGAHVVYASKVHSRFGLAFTGVVQLCCSSIMSFSIMALIGWNGWGSSRMPTTLPTYILPFVIVIVGAENMSTLTKAVFSIPFTYSVPVRIGLALSKVGTTISFTSLTDIFILSLVWFFVNLRPVREFCVFAAVVIMVDWFMLHTFFLTVLSIDAQRLELADVLAAPEGGDTKPEDAKAALEAELNRGYNWHSLLRARSARMTSLVLLLCFVGLIYWYTESHRAIISPIADLYGYTPSHGSYPPPVATPFHTTIQDLLALNPAQTFWRALNPLGFPRIPVSIPAASIIILPKTGYPKLPIDLRKLTIRPSRILLPRLKPLFYVFKVVVLPQAVTLATLWGILMFLLKDAELLDAQRDRLGRGEHDPHEPSISTEDGEGVSKARGMKGYILPCSHQSDVDMLATSPDGRMSISLGLDNSVILWRFDGEGSGTRESIEVDPTGGTVMDVAIREDKRLVAVLTVSGIELYEAPEDGSFASKGRIALPEGKTASHIAFQDFSSVADDPFATPNASAGGREAALLVACADGTVLSISDQNVRDIISPPEQPGPVQTFFFRPISSPRDLHILIVSPSRIWLYTSHQGNWHRTQLRTHLEPNDRITCAGIITVDQGPMSFIALGHRSGLVEIFNSSGQHVASQHDTGESILDISLASTSSSRCAACGSEIGDGFFIVARSSSRTDLLRVIPRGTQLCRCAASRPGMARSASNEAILQRTERIPSLVIPPSSPSHKSPGASPRKSPSLLPPVPKGDFPVSSHGTRRHSNMHREDTGDSPAHHLLSPNSANTTTAGPSWAEIDVHSFGGIDTTSGNSRLIGEKVVGMRRKGRGIDDEGWQIWVLDLQAPWNGHCISVKVITLQELLLQTPPTAIELGMKDRRAQRLVSMSGRSPFPLPNGTRDALAVPTYSGMAYVQIGPMGPLGSEGLVIALGNRMAMVRLPQEAHPSGSKKAGRAGALSNGGSLNVTPPPKRIDVSESRKSS